MVAELTNADVRKGAARACALARVWLFLVGFVCLGG